VKTDCRKNITGRSLDCFRRFDSRRKSRWSQRRILCDPGDPWNLLRP